MNTDKLKDFIYEVESLSREVTELEGEVRLRGERLVESFLSAFPDEAEILRKAELECDNLRKEMDAINLKLCSIEFLVRSSNCEVCKEIEDIINRKGASNLYSGDAVAW